MSKTVKIMVSKHRYQVPGAPDNFTVAPIEWDLGDPICSGSTLEEALTSLSEHYDDEVNLEITKTEIV